MRRLCCLDRFPRPSTFAGRCCCWSAAQAVVLPDAAAAGGVAAAAAVDVGNADAWVAACHRSRAGQLGLDAADNVAAAAAAGQD